MTALFMYLGIYVSVYIFTLSFLKLRQVHGLNMRASRRVTRREAAAHPMSQRWDGSPPTQSSYDEQTYEEATATYASPVVLDWIVDVDMQDDQTVRIFLELSTLDARSIPPDQF